MMLAAVSKRLNGGGHGGFLKLHRVIENGEVSKAVGLFQAIAKVELSLREAECDRRVLNIGVPPKLAKPRKKRGGAHNRRDRVSYALTSEHVGGLLKAAEHAQRIGLPLNRMINIHWEAAGLVPSEIGRASARFLDQLSKTVARQKSGFAWLVVHENGDGKGAHSHILAHVPSELVPKLPARQKAWLRAITGRPYRAKVILSRPVGGRVGTENTHPALYAQNLEEALHYVLKGAEPKAIKAFDLTKQQPGGRIIGKRCGTSQNIGPKARKDYKNERFKNFGL